jgi:pilus assembly protein CpaB
MNWKTLLSLTVAIVMGLAAMYVGKDLVLGKAAPQSSGAKLVAVVFAKHDMDPGTVLTADDLVTQAIPQEVASPAALKDPKPLIGRALIAPVAAGTPLRDSLLAAPGSQGGITSLIPAGKRAVAVDVNESSGVAGLIVPGARVDVIATLRQAEGEMARTIVENVKVQAVNRRMGRMNDDPKAEPQPVKTVTLIVEPKDAEAIELAGNNGRLRLVLRGLSDDKPTASNGLTYQQLTGIEAPRPQAPMPTTAPTEPSAMDKFLAAMTQAAQNARTQEPRMERRTVPVIRGGAEGVIVYERPAGVFKDPDEGWTVASHQPGQQSDSNRDNNTKDSKDPFH